MTLDVFASLCVPEYMCTQIYKVYINAGTEQSYACVLSRWGFLFPDLFEATFLQI